ALRDEEILSSEDGLLDLWLGRRRDRLLDEILGSVDENAGGLAAGVLQDLPTRRVWCVSGDLGPTESLGVRPGSVPIDTPQVDGSARRDGVQDGAGRELLVGIEVLVPAAALDPRACWNLAEHVPDPVRAVFRRVTAPELDPHQGEPEPDDVSVCIGERGDDGGGRGRGRSVTRRPRSRRCRPGESWRRPEAVESRPPDLWASRHSLRGRRRRRARAARCAAYARQPVPQSIRSLASAAVSRRRPPRTRP